MKSFRVVVLVTLFFVVEITWAAPTTGPACIAENYGFKRLPLVDYPVVEWSTDPMDMPPVRSQDQVGMCNAFAVTTALEKVMCKSEKTVPCAKIAADTSKMISVMDLSRFNVEITDGSRRSMRETFVGLEFGGATNYTLGNALAVGWVYTEKCAPFRAPVATGATIEETNTLHRAAWVNVETQYHLRHPAKPSKNSTQNKFSAERNERDAEKIKKDFNLPQTVQSLAQAFSESSQAKYLEKVFIDHECNTDQDTIVLPDGLGTGRYPTADVAKDQNENRRYLQVLSKLREVLRTDTPVIVNAFCTAAAPDFVKQECEAGKNHAFLITGVKRICKTKFMNCREMIQIQNSWGDEFQKACDNGWFEARSLLARTFYRPEILSWVTQ